MMRTRSATLTIAATAMIATTAPPRLHAQESTATRVISGRCEYPDRVARYRHETVLVMCDTVSISRRGGQATFNFSQRSWGSMIQFTGDISDNRMTVRRVSLRDGSSIAATGTCEIFNTSGQLSTVGCLARNGTRSWAANFTRSRI